MLKIDLFLLFLLKKAKFFNSLIAARPKEGEKNRKPLFDFEVLSRYMAYIPGSTNILGKQSNRGSGGELAIQSCELIETEIGKRETNEEK